MDIKPGSKTTEFITSLLTILFQTGAGSGAIGMDPDAYSTLVAQVVQGIVAVVLIFSRTSLKKSVGDSAPK